MRRRETSTEKIVIELGHITLLHTPVALQEAMQFAVNSERRYDTDQMCFTSNV